METFDCCCGIWPFLFFCSVAYLSHPHYYGLLILSEVVWREWGQPAAAGWQVAALQTVNGRGANFVGLSVNKSRL